MQKYIFLLIIYLGCMPFYWYWYKNFANCTQWLCWNNVQEMFLQAEISFRKDIDTNKQKHILTPANKCKYHLSSIAYWFAVVESWLWKGKLAKKRNNRFSVKKWSWKYTYKWIKNRWKTKKTGYLHYPNPYYATLDFMYLYKYWYSCKLWIKSVSWYKLWRFDNSANTKRYHKALLWTINYFENKYFWKWENIFSYEQKQSIPKKSTIQTITKATKPQQSPNQKTFNQNIKYIVHTTPNWKLFVIQHKNNWKKAEFHIQWKIFDALNKVISYLDQSNHKKT